ncbi:hypothetical protein GGI10_001569 [Coemansia sp. RSA 2530]|nr:hypothetical protein GGI10_001569 [Coemansia sp. RSA 2530]
MISAVARTSMRTRAVGRVLRSDGHHNTSPNGMHLPFDTQKKGFKYIYWGSCAFFSALPVIGEGKKTDRANATKGQRTAAATEGDSGAKATEVPVDEADEAVIQQGSLLTAEAIDTPDTSDEKPMKGGKVTSRGYLGWVLTQSKPYKTMKPGRTNFINGSNRPFPLNPAFRPRMPLPDAKKEEIYKDYLSDPVKNTPRILGAKYHISIKRVEAIIKLKAIEHHMVNAGEIVAQKSLTAGMESILGISKDSATVTEKLLSEVHRVGAPRFHAVPEEEEFTAVDAAEVLGRKPYQLIVDRLTASKPFVVDYEGLDPKFAPRPVVKLSKSETAKLESLGPAEEQVLDKDETLASRRWKFVFTDIGKSDSMADRKVLIRDKDGTLKLAGREYKLKRYGQVWKH